jgi:hypothetical protein
VNLLGENIDTVKKADKPYCKVMHPVARTIKAVKIKSLFATTLQDIYYVLITIPTCFSSFSGHLQVILTILNVKIKVTIPTTDPLYIAKSIVCITGKGCHCLL